ncbi:MAG: hypothetical protein IK078_08215, partial [Lachnospiraceae bacterium]|nr:hypothetical protein [Lachnospiraceae bacterium]
ADLAQNGDPSGQAAIEAASTLHNAAFRYKQNTIMDKSQLEYHKEVNAMTEYVSDIINGGLVYANLRQDYRCVIEDAAKDKNAKADYSDPAAAADLILAQTMMGKTPRATKYWEDFPDNDTALQKKDEILKSVQKNRELIVTDPMFNTILLDKQQTSLGDFAKNYEKNAAREADKLKKQAEKSRKEKEKETKRQQKEAEKKRKAEEAKKKKEDASKKKEQKIQKKPA